MYVYVLKAKSILNTQTFAFICGSLFLLIATSAADLFSCKRSAAPCDCSGLHPDYQLADKILIINWVIFDNILHPDYQLGDV